MKEQNRIIFVILLVGLSVFSFGQERGKSIRITGIDYRFDDFFSIRLLQSEDSGVYNHDDIMIGFGGLRDTADSFNIRNGNLTVPILSKSYDIHDINWTGSGSYYVHIIFYDSKNHDYYRYVSKRKISFGNTITEIPCSNFNFKGSDQGQ